MIKVKCYDIAEVNSTNSAEIKLSSQEKQYLTYNLIQSIRYTNTNNEFLEELMDIFEGQSVIAVLEKYGKIVQIYPLHEFETLNTLKSIWVKQLWTRQPLGVYCYNLTKSIIYLFTSHVEDIVEYFGMRIGLYFAWLENYTYSLTIPAVIGVLVWICLWDSKQYTRDLVQPVFGLFNILWISLFLEYWKLKSNQIGKCMNENLGFIQPIWPLYKVRYISDVS